jgi:predicted mannosyl-3-phosphoglycerate phosphatase (HAD superfamily)
MLVALAYQAVRARNDALDDWCGTHTAEATDAAEEVARFGVYPDAAALADQIEARFALMSRVRPESVS